MHSEPDHLLLRRYADARELGRPDEAAATWERLAINNFDRVKQIVRAFRFSAGGPGIAEFDQGSAVTEAYLRVVSMGADFRKREVGQFYAALVTCVQNTCRDFGRKELRHEKRATGSFDDTYEPEGEAGRYDAALAAYDAQLREQAVDAVESEIARQGDEQFVAWAVGQVLNEKQRVVLQMTLVEKLPAEEIAGRLDISLDNVYTRRSRGIKELQRILRDSRS